MQSSAIPKLLFWERLPGWIPKVGGATAPWGMVKAFNHLAGKNNLDWRAERKSHARRAHIIEALMTGQAGERAEDLEDRRSALGDAGAIFQRKR